MKRTLIALLGFSLSAIAMAQSKIQLPSPNMERQTASVMNAFMQRQSIRSYSQKMLSQQDLSDLLWAAQGKNRADGRLTAPTAMNRQEIRVYLFTQEGAYLYQPQTHTLEAVAEGDHRQLIAGRQAFAKEAPVSLLLVADMEKFGSNNEHARWMVGVDVGIVTQNIDLFCAAAGLCTVPRGTMEHKALKELLGLGENQEPVINNPVGYPKE